MAQFWCEFTKEVLTEFLNEDFLIKEMNGKENRKQANLASATVVAETIGDNNSQAIPSVKASSKHNNQNENLGNQLSDRVAHPDKADGGNSWLKGEEDIDPKDDSQRSVAL